MSSFLERMAGVSRARLDEARASEPFLKLRRRAANVAAPPVLRMDGGFGLIAELKLRSPALGGLGDGSAALSDRVTAYAEAGAMAVSVLTEPSEFNGSLAHLETAAKVLEPHGVPAMRKDFLVDPYQLYEARAAGAGGVLLIVRLLSRELLTEMVDCARELGLFVLLEAFDAEDIERATAEVAVGVPEWSIRIARSEGTPPPDPGRGVPIFLGVNCRDLRTLEVLPRRFHELAPRLPEGVVRVAESGITTPEECAEAVRMGYDAALVGGALMVARNPGGLIRAMLKAGRAAA